MSTIFLRKPSPFSMFLLGYNFMITTNGSHTKAMGNCSAILTLVDDHHERATKYLDINEFHFEGSGNALIGPDTAYAMRSGRINHMQAQPREPKNCRIFELILPNSRDIIFGFGTMRVNNTIPGIFLSDLRGSKHPARQYAPTLITSLLGKRDRLTGLKVISGRPGVDFIINAKHPAQDNLLR